MQRRISFYYEKIMLLSENECKIDFYLRIITLVIVYHKIFFLNALKLPVPETTLIRFSFSDLILISE